MKDRKPERATRKEQEEGFVSLEEERPMPRRPKPSTMFKPAIIVGLAVLLIAYLMIGGIGVSKDDFTKNVQDILVTIEGIDKKATATKTAVDQALASLSDTVTAQVNTALLQITDRMGAVEGVANNANNLATSANSKSDAVNANIATLTASANDLAGKLDVANAKIVAMEAQSTADRARIMVLEQKWATQETTQGSISVSLHDTTPFVYVDSETVPYAYANIVIQIDNDSVVDVDVEDITLNVDPSMYNYPSIGLITSTSLTYSSNTKAVPPLYWFDDFNINNINRTIKVDKYIRLTLIYKAYLTKALTVAEVTTYIVPMGIDPDIELADYNLD